MSELEEYFRKLRFSKNHHLGLGDVRLTVAMQEEVIAIARKESRLTTHEAERGTCPVCEGKKFYTVLDQLTACVECKGSGQV